MTSARVRIDVQQRRARLGRRHLLAPGFLAKQAEEVAAGVVALHATDPASVHLSTAARLVDPRVEQTEDALYGRRTLIRMLGMRRTMFVVPVELAPVVQGACTDAIAANERQRLIQHLATHGDLDGRPPADPERFLADVEEGTLAALARLGSATAAALSEAEPRLRTSLLPAGDKDYHVRTNICTRVLMVLAARGLIVRGRPRGSWISGQYHWSPVDSWLPAGMPELAAGPARTELVRRWLERYGPGTLADLKWWTGLTMRDVKAAIAGLPTVPVDLDGAEGVVLAGDADPVPVPDPWVALLPALDPSVMGWVGREWYLGEHGPALFDRSGNPGPTVWSDGRIVGGWAQRADGQIAVRLLEDPGGDARAAIDAAAERLTGWLGPVRVTPRFRTPLERELSS